MSFGYAATEESEVIYVDTENEKVDDDSTILDEIRHPEISNVLHTCAGLKENKYSLVGQRLISKWIEFTCHMVSDKKMRSEPFSCESNPLHDTLILLSLKSLKSSMSSNVSINLDDIINLMVVAWNQNMKTWKKDVLTILIDQRAKASSPSLLEIRNELLSKCSF